MMILTLESGIMKNFIERSITFIRLGEISNVFVMFVIQPLYLLNGDANFRQGYLEKGMEQFIDYDFMKCS